jgi:8-oxo-dGTP diphosphatase
MTKNLLEPKVHVFVEKEGRFLFLRRFNTGCYDGFWTLPTGRVEKGEFPETAAKRETLEEVGITIETSFVSTVYAKVPHVLSNDQTEYEDLCFFFKGMTAENPYNCEPEKHDKLEWFSLNGLPTPLMPVTNFGIQCYLQKKTYGEFNF